MAGRQARKIAKKQSEYLEKVSVFDHVLLLELLVCVYYVVVVIPLNVVSWVLKRLGPFKAERWNNLLPRESSYSPLRPLGLLLQHVCVKSGLFEHRVYVKDCLLPHENGPSLSFAGGGMLWPYYLGVAHHIYQNYDHKNLKFLASSGGCFGAVPLAMGLDPYDWCAADWPKCLAHYASRSLGTFFDATEFYWSLWDAYLPADAHERANGRLYLSITLFPSFKSEVVSQFETRADLINCIIASTCLPMVFMRTLPRTSFGLALDGGLGNDQPLLDRWTVTCGVMNPAADVSSDTKFTMSQFVLPPTLAEAMVIAEAAARDAARCEAFRAHGWEELAKR